MTEPKWMIRARSYVGLKEVAGTKRSAEIVKWFEESGHGWIKDDETAWCAAFVNAMLVRAGVKGTGSVAARSFLDWGKPLAAPVPGCVAVFWRVKRAGWQGHVAFFVSETKTRITVLGGNQANAVSIASYPRSRLLGYRWPVEAAAVEPAPKPGGVDVKVNPPPSYSRATVRDVQERLIGHGYVQAGGIDGLMGDKTRSAIRDFRAKNGLPEGDDIDAALVAALRRPDAVRPVILPERANATLDDLQNKGSVIADASQKSTKGAMATVAAGLGTVGSGMIEQAGGLANLGPALAPFKELFDQYGIYILGTVIVVMGGFIWWQARRAGEARLQDHRSGNTSVVNLADIEQEGE